MPDARLSLTAQDLAYAATGLRLLARQAEERARDPQFESCRALFEDSAKSYDERARKFDRVAAALNGEPETVHGNRHRTGRSGK